MPEAMLITAQLFRPSMSNASGVRSTKQSRSNPVGSINQVITTGGGHGLAPANASSTREIAFSLDRPMSNRHRSPESALRHECQRLTHFSFAAHQYGSFLSELAWQVYACGTYRRSMGEDGARATFKSYLDRLERALGSAVACVFVLERRKTSSLGMSPSALHWHFAVAAPTQYRATLDVLVPELWTRLFGNCKSEPYCPELPGMFYIAKTASEANFDWDLHNFERIYIQKDRDLFAEQQTDSFVPDHVRHRVYAETLTMRPVDSDLSLVAAKTSCRSTPPKSTRVEARGRHRGRHW